MHNDLMYQYKTHNLYNMNMRHILVYWQWKMFVFFFQKKSLLENCFQFFFFIRLQLYILFSVLRQSRSYWIWHTNRKYTYYLYGCIWMTYNTCIVSRESLSSCVYSIERIYAKVYKWTSINTLVTTSVPSRHTAILSIIYELQRRRENII